MIMSYLVESPQGPGFGGFTTKPFKYRHYAITHQNMYSTFISYNAAIFYGSEVFLSANLITQVELCIVCS
jgi:hypothetical protein